MAKAEITLKSGARMTIEGTPDEIMEIKSKIEVEPLRKTQEKKISKIGGLGIRKSKNGPVARISELIDGDFFKEKKSINDIKEKLSEKAIFYNVTSLSPALIRLVNKGRIRRIKEEKRWAYVNA